MADAHEFLEDDPYIGPLIDRFGHLELDPAESTFERLIVSVLRQQVSTASAEATRKRLYDAVEITPTGILAADTETLKDCGLSRQKASYVTNIAEAFDSTYEEGYFEDLDDQAVVDELTTITGVGEWTAHMQLLFALGRPDVFPVGDLAIRKGMETVFGEEMSRAEMVERAERWKPYRSYASLYLWRAYENAASDGE